VNKVNTKNEPKGHRWATDGPFSQLSIFLRPRPSIYRLGDLDIRPCAQSWKNFPIPKMHRKDRGGLPEETQVYPLWKCFFFGTSEIKKPRRDTQLEYYQTVAGLHKWNHSFQLQQLFKMIKPFLAPRLVLSWMEATSKATTFIDLTRPKRCQRQIHYVVGNILLRSALMCCISCHREKQDLVCLYRMLGTQSYMCVCIYVCVYVYVYIYIIHTQTHVFICTVLFIPTCVALYTIKSIKAIIYLCVV